MTLKYHTRRDYMKIIGKNPITGLDYPDPDVIRVDDTYYMVSTTMHFVPGCEILRSYDLVHWEHLSYVYERLDSTEEQRLVGEKNCYGKGMWAASLRYHKGMYYICFVANDTGKTYLYIADNIEGSPQKSKNRKSENPMYREYSARWICRILTVPLSLQILLVPPVR